jgi:hypothetical protein
MRRRVTPSQFRSMLRRQEQTTRRAIQDYNRAVGKHNREAKRAVDDYNRQVRSHNARVRANRRRLRSELQRLARQPSGTTRVYVRYRTSVETLHTSFLRLESSPVRTEWGAAGEELFDLAEGEAANSVRSLNTLLSPAEADAEDRPELRETSLANELREISSDLDQRWRGALFALNPANPDAARHFCTSSREILASVLDIEAPDEVVLAGISGCPVTVDGRPTRRAKIQFCLERTAVAAPELVDFVDSDLENVSSLFAVFNDGTHGHAGRFDLDQLASLKIRVEDAIRFLHRLVR